MLGKVTFFSLIRRLRLRLSRHLPPREGFWSAASDEAMCCACVPSPMRGRWRGAPDEVVDVNERPPHPSFLPSVEKPAAAAQPHRRSAEKAKPFDFFLRLAPHRRGEGFWHASPGQATHRVSPLLPLWGEGFWLAASNQAVSRASVGFSLGWRSCHQARRAQMTDEGEGYCTKTGW